jgi:hypothetical protein
LVGLHNCQMSTHASHLTNDLSELIDQELRTPVSPASLAMTDALRSRYGDAVLGIVYYGSCFRTGTEQDGILDIFVVVDNYRNVYQKRALVFANKLLPPNVFYYELDFEGDTVRTKYAVITLDQFVHRNSSQCFHTFFWARFAQPCALTYVRSEAVRATLVASFARAIETFVARVLPLLPPSFDAQTLWNVGLSASYRTELRPESPGASARLIDNSLARYRAVTAMTLARRQDVKTGDDDPSSPEYIASIPELKRWLTRQSWRLRRPQGKLINLFRIMKAAFTFDGGVDYVLWKIERHSGVKIEATPMLRRHPLLTCWPTVWRLYRAGAFR